LLGYYCNFEVNQIGALIVDNDIKFLEDGLNNVQRMTERKSTNFFDQLKLYTVLYGVDPSNLEG
jgi:hypothetical protein